MLTEPEAVAWLGSAAAVRARAEMMLALAEGDGLPHFVYRPEQLAPTVDYVLETIRANYPDLAIPFHSRWRHFSAGGRDRWAELASALGATPRDEIARIRFDLAVTSVLLDAGAGARWSYREADGATFNRSEGLAVASFHLFRAGLFSAAPDRAPLRADGSALIGVSADALGRAMQVSPANPLLALEGRADLMGRLGQALSADPVMFGAKPRIGNLFDYLRARAGTDGLEASEILTALIHGLGSIWPGRVSLGSVNLGDVWRHSAIRAGDATDRLVPFHKLSQWLAYSLIEPLEDAGVPVIGVNRLTGLAEYRNGGLMIDRGLIVPRDSALPSRPLAPGDEAVVEWRALTVALLDRIAAALRDRLGLDEDAFPLARALEGGTWAAGRRAALALRPGGGPPLDIVSDGTVF